MGKHETAYVRVDRDLYPTRERWVVEALAQHVDLAGAMVWECAAGTGEMAESLKAVGAARVLCSDIIERSYPVTVLDFTSRRRLNLSRLRLDWIVTNPPGGARNSTAERFIEAGLGHIADRTALALALLLPVDFDSAKTRRKFFDDCPLFLAKIVLTERIVWFERADGEREAPKENHAWFIWSRAVLHMRRSPIILYGPTGPEHSRRMTWRTGATTI